MSISVVILAGGSGTRLWPLSRSMHPKQFFPLLNDHTMIRNTIDRVKHLDVDSIIIVTNAEHRFLMSEQIKDLDLPIKVILEPFQRNTAAAICLAALSVKEEDLLLVLSADHYIEDQDLFIESINKALPFAQSNNLVSFGIVPSSPNTGYGYIKVGAADGDGYAVEEYVEKPEAFLAEEYFSSGNYYWNSGIFIFKANKYLSELGTFSKDTLDACNKSLLNTEDFYEFLTIDEEAFSKCPNISVDCAVMEKTKEAIVVPLECNWSDIGSWASLLESKEKDEDNNYLQGDVIATSSTNSYIRSENKLLVALGIDDLIVVSTKDAIMVANKNKTDEIKKIVDCLKESGRSETELHREVYRPWGKYDSIDSGENYQVKKITVKPGAKLSTQFHNHRSEHWVVISGIANVIKGKDEIVLHENNSIYIDVGEIHSLENRQDIDLEIIEVQTGSYLGEDDIVRVEDRYGRS